MEILKRDLKDLSSIRIGGQGDVVVIAQEGDLKEVCTHAKDNNLKLHILGEGTNTVFKDDISNLLIVKIEIKGLNQKEFDTHVELTVGAGENWDATVLYAVNKNWWGIENLSNIPGTVGAGPVQNIGAYGMELKDSFISLRAFDTKLDEFVTLKHEDCKFKYRDSIFKHEVGRYIITSITIKLSKVPRPVLTYKPLDTLVSKKDLTIQNVRDVVIQTRAQKLPDYRIYPNVGSFFKNPIVNRTLSEDLCKRYLNIPLHKTELGYKISCAWLIEHIAEMKGLRTGDIGTWPAQPLVIVNYGNATFKEVEEFSSIIIQKIKDDTGITLEREVNFVG
jgi:UDP-N-acetylmuramate dehydrogenase